MRVAISGASGLIGSALARDLTADGSQVVRLVRHAASAAGEIGWDPRAGKAGLDPAALSGLDAVVHLSGAPIASGRWTQARKELLRASRIESTRILATAMAAADAGPRILLCGSAIGYYGDTGDQITDETAPSGTGFLASLVSDWEAAAERAVAAGVRVVYLRTGVVLTPDGGMLGRLLLPFRLGLGAKVGSGRQYLSWISITDETRAIGFLLGAADASGPVNLTAPEPVTNAEFTSALAEAVRRPAVLGLPSAALRAALGEVAGELLGSARIVPRKLTDSGFAFAHPDVASALTAMLSR